MPVARFQMPDGKVARFEVPEGTTPEQAQALIAREFPNIAPKAESPYTLKEAGRQIGLTARAGLKGITAIPAMVGDALGMRSSASVDNLADMIGLPKPVGATERVVGDVAGAMAGQGGVYALGRGMANAAGPVVSRIGDLLGQRAGAQIVGAAGGAAGAGTARESGAGPVGQTVAGLVGGIAAPVAMDAGLQGAKAVARGIGGATKGFSTGGREEIVGTTLQRMTTDPTRAMANLDEAATLVPSSQPTTAQAARDPGMLTAERAIRSGQGGAQFAERFSQQNAARNAVLNGLAGDDAALNAAKGARTAEGAKLYEAALSQSVKPDDTLVSLAQRPAFSRALARAQEIAAEEGINLGDPKNTVRGLHYVKMALDDTLDTSTLSGIGKTQQRAIAQTRDDLLKWLDNAAPAYSEARTAYTKASGPVNQLEALQDVRGRVLNAGTDAVTGERIMSPAKFYGAVTKPEARAELAKVLTKEQLGKLDEIAADLDRGALSDSAGRAAGSNTYQNVSTAYILGRALGGKTPDSPLAQNLMRPIAWLNKLNEPALQSLLTDAMLDPALARTLMGKASPRAIESVSLELGQRARALGLGGALGTLQGTEGQSR